MELSDGWFSSRYFVNPFISDFLFDFDPIILELILCEIKQTLDIPRQAYSSHCEPSRASVTSIVYYFMSDYIYTHRVGWGVGGFLVVSCKEIWLGPARAMWYVIEHVGMYTDHVRTKYPPTAEPVSHNRGPIEGPWLDLVLELFSPQNGGL